VVALTGISNLSVVKRTSVISLLPSRRQKKRIFVRLRRGRAEFLAASGHSQTVEQSLDPVIDIAAVRDQVSWHIAAKKKDIEGTVPRLALADNRTKRKP
jgi:hypothetical protein